jgi:hypothetical protein
MIMVTFNVGILAGGRTRRRCWPAAEIGPADCCPPLLAHRSPAGVPAVSELVAHG